MEMRIKGRRKEKQRKGRREGGRNSHGYYDTEQQREGGGATGCSIQAVYSKVCVCVCMFV